MCVAVVATACGLADGERFGRAGALPGVVRIHVAAPIAVWDPPRAREGLERAVALQAFAALVERDGRPRLARGIRHDAHAGIVVVSLDPNARFSDGAPIDADAVVWSWRRALLRSTGTVDLEPFTAIANGRALAEGRLLRVARPTVGGAAPYATVGAAPDLQAPLELAPGAMVRVVDTNERRPCCGRNVPLRRGPDEGEALGSLNPGDVGTVIGARTVRGRSYLLLRSSTGASGWADQELVTVHVPPASLLRVVDRGDGSAALRVGPDEEAPTRELLVDGAVVEVLGEDEGWVHAVDYGSGHMGFVARRALEPLRGEQQWLRVEPIGPAAVGSLRAWVSLRDVAFDPSALGARAVDATTIEIETASDAAAVVAALAHPALVPVPPHVVAAHGRAWTEPAHLVSSGPFAPSATSDRHLTLVRSASSFESARALLERVEFVVVTDPIAAVHLYRAGELDVVMTLPAELAAGLAHAADFAASDEGGGLIAPEVRGLAIDRLDLRDVTMSAP